MTDEGLLDTRYGVKGVTYTWNEDRATLTLTQDATDDMANGSKNYAMGSCMLLDNYARRRHWETMLSLCFLPDFGMHRRFSELLYGFSRFRFISPMNSSPYPVLSGCCLHKYNKYAIILLIFPEAR